MKELIELGMSDNDMKELQTQWKNELTELGISDKHLADLRAQWEVVPDCSEVAGYNAVKLGISQIRKTRTTIEKRRKKYTKRLLDYKRDIDAEAKRRTAQLVKIETPLKEAKDTEDERVERARQEEIRKEAERQQRITNKIASMGLAVLKSLGGTADDIEEGLNFLRGMDTEDCDERKDVADKTLGQSIASLEEAWENKKDAEELKRREAEIAAKEKAQREEEERQSAAARKIKEKEAEQKRKDALKEMEGSLSGRFAPDVQGGVRFTEDGRMSAFDVAEADGIDDAYRKAGVDVNPMNPFDPEMKQTKLNENAACSSLMVKGGLSSKAAAKVLNCIIAGEIPGVSWNG